MEREGMPRPIIFPKVKDIGDAIVINNITDAL